MNKQEIKELFPDYNLGSFEGKEEGYNEQMLLLQKLIFAGFPDYVNYKLHEYEKEGLCTPEMYVLYIQSCIIRNARAYAVKHAVDFLKKCNGNIEKTETLLGKTGKIIFVGEQIISLIQKKPVIIRRGGGISKIVMTLPDQWSYFDENQRKLDKKSKNNNIHLVNSLIDTKWEHENMEQWFYGVFPETNKEIRQYRKAEKERKELSGKYHSLLEKIKTELQKTKNTDEGRMIRLFLYTREERRQMFPDEEKNDSEFLLKADSETILFYLLKGEWKNINFGKIKPVYEKILNKNIFLFIDIFVNYGDSDLDGLELVENIIDSEDKKREYDECKEYFSVIGIDNSLLSLIEKAGGNIQLKIKLEKEGQRLKEQIEEQKSSLEEEKQKLEDDKIVVARSQASIDKQMENSFNVLLKRRTELEYALSKSAIDELGLDNPDFYHEMQEKVEQVKDSTKTQTKFCDIKKGFGIGFNIWFRNFFLKNHRREQLNYVLPTLRASYLGEWKEFLIEAGRIITGEKIPDSKEYKFDINQVEKTSDKIQGMVDRFDQILKNDQERNLREKVFNWLIIFLVIETIVIFGFVYIVVASKDSTREMQTLLNILIPATLAQITAMIFYIVKSLFPNKEERIPENNGKIELKTDI